MLYAASRPNTPTAARPTERHHGPRFTNQILRDDPLAFRGATKQSCPVDRRKLLQAAAAAPAVPLLVSAPATGPCRRKAAPPRFAIAVLPDTQYLFDADSADPEPLRETFRRPCSRNALAVS